MSDSGQFMEKCATTCGIGKLEIARSSLPDMISVMTNTCSIKFKSDKGDGRPNYDYAAKFCCDPPCMVPPTWYPGLD